MPTFGLSGSAVALAKWTAGSGCRQCGDGPTKAGHPRRLTLIVERGGPPLSRKIADNPLGVADGSKGLLHLGE